MNTIVISAINHRKIGVICTNLANYGAPLCRYLPFLRPRPLPLGPRQVPDAPGDAPQRAAHAAGARDPQRRGRGTGGPTGGLSGGAEAGVRGTQGGMVQGVNDDSYHDIYDIYIYIK